jgi:hypothetical protein
MPHISPLIFLGKVLFPDGEFNSDLNFKKSTRDSGRDSREMSRQGNLKNKQYSKYCKQSANCETQCMIRPLVSSGIWLQGDRHRGKTVLAQDAEFSPQYYPTPAEDILTVNRSNIFTLSLKLSTFHTLFGLGG